MLGPTVVLSTLIIVSGLTIFYLIRSRHVERMTRIEHGLDEPNPDVYRSGVKSFGIFLISLSLAIFCSYLFSKLFNLPDHVLIPGLLLLFGGLSLIIISRIDK